jgi:DNA-binding MarR family transcriptional regulator
MDNHERWIAFDRRVVDDRRLEYRGGRRSHDVWPSPLNALTTKQRRILEEIDRYEQANGEPCSGRYLARRFNVHHATVQEHLERLYHRGWLTSPNSPSALRQPLR